MRLPFFNKKQERKTPGPLNDFWYQVLTSFRSGTEQVNADSVKNLAAVMACRQAIGETFAMLPVDVMKKTGDDAAEPASDHPLARLLQVAPNRNMDALIFKEQMINGCLDGGNCYAYIERSRTNKILGLFPLHWCEMTIEVESAAGIGDRLVFFRTLPGGGKKRIEQEDIFHLPVNSKEGILGKPLWSESESVFRLALAVQKHGIDFFENGTILDFAIKTQKKFPNKQDRKNYVDDLKEALFDMKNVAVLEAGIELESLNMTNHDAQFKETKDEAALEIARLYRVPPVFLQMMDKGMSFKSVEQLAIFFAQYTIQPWATRFEMAMNRQLLDRYGQTNHFIKFNIDALSRGDLKTRTEAIVMRLQNGLMSINEARNLEDMNPIGEGGNEYWMPTNNMQPISQVLNAPMEEEPAPEPEPLPAPEPEEKSKEDDSLAERMRSIVSSTLKRMVTKEMKALKAALKRDKFDEWFDPFYDKHEEHVREALSPVFEAFSREKELDTFVSAYIESRREHVLSNRAIDAVKETEEGTEVILKVFTTEGADNDSTSSTV